MRIICLLAVHFMEVVIFLGGIALLIVSAYLYNELPHHDYDDIGAIDQVFLKSFISWRNFTDEKDEAITHSISESFYTETIILTITAAIGLSLIVVAVAGVFLDTCNHPIFMFIYINAIGVLVAITAKVRFNIDRLVYRSLKATIKHYKGANDTSIAGHHLNNIMHNKGCCGVNDYKDFSQGGQWPGTIDEYNLSTVMALHDIRAADFPTKEWLNYTSFFQSFVDYLTSRGCRVDPSSKLAHCDWMYTHKFLTPIACCRDIEDVFNGCHFKGIANSTNNNMNTGCGRLLLKQISGGFYNHLPILFGVFFIVMSLYMILLTILLILQQNYLEEAETSMPVAIYGEFDEMNAMSDSKIALIAPPPSEADNSGHGYVGYVNSIYSPKSSYGELVYKSEQQFISKSVQTDPVEFVTTKKSS